MSSAPVLCLMGPTASGKTAIAVEIAAALPVDVVSVDSALVYRGMDIGTAKPTPQVLASVPHRLIDIRDPEQAYSAGEFVRDAEAEIRSIHGAGRIPLLVGGTMLYFRSLVDGIADLPEADPDIRARIDAAAERDGWPALHAELARADPGAAQKINPNDSQRIQRALEVFRASGRTITDWQQSKVPGKPAFRFIKIALIPGSREVLRERIETRLEAMFEQGFVEEVRCLMRRPDLHQGCPSMRAVGYRQVWSHLDGRLELPEAVRKSLFATRQLAKRQLTWLRSERDLLRVDPLQPGALDAVLEGFSAKIERFG